MITVEERLNEATEHVEVDHQFDALTASMTGEGKVSKTASGPSELVDATAARERIKTWHDNGVSLNTIAKLSGVGKTSLSRILYGRSTGGIAPQEEIRVNINNLILGLDISPELFTGTIDATGTRRRIEALTALGFAGRAISESSGVGPNVLWEIQSTKRVKVGTARAIKAAYEELRNTEPSTQTPAENSLVLRAKNRAKKANWLPPSAWDEVDIDDPSQTPRVPEVIRDCQCKRVRHEHGTHNAYLTDKCRCLPCKKANAAASVHNRKMKAYGRGPNTTPVDAKPVQKHIKKLMRNGWGVERIAKEAGVGTSTVSRILYGEPARKIRPPKTVLGKTSDKILAFNPEKREQRQGTVIETVDSTGTKRRIQALVACGYSMTRIADEMGTYKQAITLIMKGERVLLSTAESYKDIYDKLWDVPPPRETPAEKKAYTTAKKMAEENGWFPPMAWDDDLIDDPKHKAAA